MREHASVNSKKYLLNKVGQSWLSLSKTMSFDKLRLRFPRNIEKLQQKDVTATVPPAFPVGGTMKKLFVSETHLWWSNRF